MESSSKGKLFLIPTVISAGTERKVIAPIILESLKTINYFLVEEVRTARRYLSSLNIYESIEDLQFQVLNKDTKEEALEKFFEPVLSGHNLGILSESGCPGVADPGAIAVNYAHRKKIKVIPIVGPSSLLLALMASGLNGQQFAFHGYLPIDAKEAARKIKELEKESELKNQTQIFIETPYRNNQIVKHLTGSLKGDTQLCIAVDLTGENEFVETKLASAWKKNMPLLPKEPAVFLFLA